MPAIAAGAVRDNAVFYWHLGDLRKISGPDQDFAQLAKQQGKTPTLQEYQKAAWDDFMDHQIAPFGAMPFFLGIGNHETIPPKTRTEFVAKFEKWLNASEVKDQRLKDDPTDDRVKTYYHWVRGGVDFINLDNASHDQFDTDQLKWFADVLARDQQDASIRTVVVGMHAALPESISSAHSMNEWHEGEVTGQKLYQDLLKLQNDAHKKVYVLASHSHFFMEGIFNTEYWRTHGGVLPGWIVGTAGAERYRLPPKATDAKAAETDVYGYLLATANPHGEAPGTVTLDFKRITEDQIPGDVVHRFTPSFVHECFAGNRKMTGMF